MQTRRTVLVGTAALAASPALAADDPFAPVDRLLAKLVAQERLPCAAIRVARHGQTLFEGHYSGRVKVGPGSLYRIYSMTKPVTACAVMALCDDGKLSLETPVAELVPEFAALKVMTTSPADTEPARPMTVAQLLTHSSGIASSWSTPALTPAYRKAGLDAGTWMFKPEIGGLAGFARRLSDIPLLFQPGDGWLYGFSHDIAGLVVERAAGEPFGAYLKRRLFQPLGMADTDFSVAKGQGGRLADLHTWRSGTAYLVEAGATSASLKPPAAESGSAGLISSLEDYSRFAGMLAGGGALGGTRVLKAETAAVMTRPHGPQDHVVQGLGKFAGFGLGGSGAGMGQAVGGVVALDDQGGPGSRGEYSWGGAASTTFWATPGSGLSVVVMTQLLPSGVVKLRDTLRPLIYGAVAG